MTVFERIKYLREKRNMSQQELAQKVGYKDKSAISKVERGERDISQSMLEKYAQALDTTPAYLMGWESNSKIGSKVNKSIAFNIRVRREQSGLTQKQFADKLGVDEKTVAMLESGQEALSQEMLYLICDTFQIKPYNIVPFNEEELDENSKYLLSRSEGDDLHINLQLFANARPIVRKRLPMLGNVACGEPIFAQESHESYVDANSDTDADFCLTAKGDSMINARIFDGDVLFVKSQPTVENGEIAVVLIEDEATVKRVYYDKENNVITLAPENPLYKPMRYEGAKLDQIRILGKVVSGQYKV